MKILIVIPIYISNELLFDFTKQTVDSIRKSRTNHDVDIMLVNNFCLGRFKKPCEDFADIFVDNPAGNGVSSAWNLGIEHGIDEGYDYIIVSNNDVVLHKDCIENLVGFAEEHPEFILWTGAEHGNLRTLNSVEPGESFDTHPHFSFFMVDQAGITSLMEKEAETKEPRPGYFDENFQAYMEDNDYHQRLIRAGLEAGKTASALFYHYGSRTIKTDEEMNKRNNMVYNNSRQYFKKKWGFDVHGRVVPEDSPERFEYGGPFEPK